jgi:hypothetical protein
MPTDTIAGMSQLRLKMLDEHQTLIKELGGEVSQNARHYSIKDIINSESYQTTWKKFWDNKQLTMCAAICGSSTILSKPKEMFIEHNNLDSSGVS